MKIGDKEVQITDCSLRDGGYYTNWDFPNIMVEKYLKSMNALPIDYVEIGYRSRDVAGYHGEYNYLPKSVLRKCKQYCPDKKLAFMINLKEVDEECVESLLVSVSDYIAIVRLATRPEDVPKAIKIARIIKSKGLEVAINIMYLSQWIEEVPFAPYFKGEEKIIDYVVMVDSYGSVFPHQIGRAVDQLRVHYKGKLGFHGHNNLELAFANTLSAISAGVDAVDATISGMGRGAGNLRMELLLTYLAKHDSTISLNVLMDTLEDFEKLRKEYQWGTNLPYMISGCNALPQKDIMEWITMKRYSTSSIVQRLQAHIQPNEIESRNHPRLDLIEREKTSLMIGGGNSVKEHLEAIIELVRRNATNVRLIFSSTKHLYLFDDVPSEVERYIYLVGIEGKRLEQQLSSLRPSDKIIVANQALPMETYIPESVQSQVYTIPTETQNEMEGRYIESPLYMSIKISLYLKAYKMYLVGYDGYDYDAKGNMYNLMEENQAVIDYYSRTYDMCSLFPSKYHHLREQSIYSFLEL